MMYLESNGRGELRFFKSQFSYPPGKPGQVREFLIRQGKAWFACRVIPQLR